MYKTLLTEIETGIFIITINRPDKLNALNKDVFNDLDKVTDEIYQNREIKSAIITGAGSKAFVAGADISEFLTLNASQAAQLSTRGHRVFDKIEDSPKPIVAAVNGFALGGGCELALACHFIYASENAKFGQPEVNLGLIPGYGGTQRLTQLVGRNPPHLRIRSGREGDNGDDPRRDPSRRGSGARPGRTRSTESRDRSSSPPSARGCARHDPPTR